MQIYLSKNTSEILNDRYVFIDNDFLNELASNESVFITFISEARIGQLLIDPITEFEFLREVFVPKQRIIKEMFLSQDIFSPITTHQETYLKIQENALILSVIYAHKKQGRGASYPDLILAGQLMFRSENSLLITGNKKHFPSCIFDTLDVLDIEQGDETVQPYYILQFNMIKFKRCEKDLKSIKD